MKKCVICFILMVVFIYPSISQTTDERTVKSFDKIKVIGEVNVFLINGNEEKIKIVATGIDLSDIETTVNDRTLQVELSRGIHMDANIEIYLTYKEINEISVSGYGKISFQSILTGDKIILNANANSELQADLSLKSVDIKVGQGAVIRLTGKTGSIDAKVSTGGILSALDFASDSTYVSVGSAGIAKVNAIYLLDAKVRTGGTLTYSGSPKQKVINTGIGASVNALE